MVEHSNNIKTDVSSWINKSKILVDIATLKYMVRGGRVSPLRD